MSDYTTQLRFICESYANRQQSAPACDVDTVIELARPKIFDFYYPIFDEDYKPELEQKILQHFYTQEIGLETVGLWKLKLRTKMREIMPYYNQLYLSERKEFDPFINTDYTDERQTVGTDNNVTTGTNASDTLQTQTDNTVDTRTHLGEADGVDVKTGNASNVSRETSNGETTDTSADTEKGTYGETSQTDFKPQADKKTLVKHADTPLGGVDGVTGNSSNYLSDVTETVENYNPASGAKDRTDVTASKDTENDREHVGASTTTSDGTKTTDDLHSDNSNYLHFDSATDNGSTDHIGTTQGTASGTTTSESIGSNASDYAGRVFGKTGSETYSEMLMKFRETFLNIDMMVINELDDLFMKIW